MAPMKIKNRIGIMPGPWPPGREGADFLWSLCDLCERTEVDRVGGAVEDRVAFDRKVLRFRVRDF